MRKVFLDENLSEYVASALNSLSKGYFDNIEVLSTKIVFGRGVVDEGLIPKIGAQQGILVTKDIAISHTRLQYELCKDHGIGVFFLNLPKGQSKHWDMVKVFITKWEEIALIIEKRKAPFAYRIQPSGKLREMD